MCTLTIVTWPHSPDRVTATIRPGSTTSQMRSRLEATLGPTMTATRPDARSAAEGCADDTVRKLLL